MRALAAWRPLVLLVALRAALALMIGAAPSAAVLDRVRHFPAGDLALLEREGVLLAELVRRAPGSPGLGVSFGVAAMLAYVLALPLLATLIRQIAHGRGPFDEALVRGLWVSPALVLVGGLSAVALAFAVYLGTMTSASLVALFPLGTPSRAAAAVVFGGLGLVPAAYGASYFDIVRVQVVLGEAGWAGRLGGAWRTLARSPFRITLRYAGLVLASALVVAGSVVLTASLLVRAGAAYLWLALATGLVTLVALGSLRAVWLGFLVRLSTNELDVLRLPEGVGYEATPEREKAEPASERALPDPPLDNSVASDEGSPRD